MPLSTGIQHRLYLKQTEYLKRPSFDEILPANFNYQNFIMVSSGVVEGDDRPIVFQTYSCGCGPQPLIRGAFLLEELSWDESAFRRLLAKSDNPKDAALVDQTVFDKVLRIRQPKNAEEEDSIARALQRHFGDNKKINFF